jgi:hypothetical protein
MPNGGYPLHVLTPVDGTDLAIHIKGRHVELMRRVPEEAAETPRRFPRYNVLGSLTDVQVAALMHHLLYWGGAPDTMHATDGAQLYVGTERIEPKFRQPGCVYDY